jgi:hypothetical protein
VFVTEDQDEEREGVRGSEDVDQLLLARVDLGAATPFASTVATPSDWADTRYLPESDFDALRPR